MKTLFKEALGYGAASGVALVVDMTILWVLVRFFGWGYLTAASASFLGGAGVAYILSIHIAFTRHRLRNRRLEFISFVAIGMVGLGLNTVVIWFVVRFLGLHYLLARCVAAGFTFVCNFIARRQILFVRRSVA